MPLFSSWFPWSSKKPLKSSILTEETPLVRGETMTMPKAVQSLVGTLRRETHEVNTPRYGVLLLVALCALFSAVLYAVSGGKAGKRYAGYAKEDPSTSLIPVLPAAGGAVTNALFNAESYLALFALMLTIRSLATKFLTGSNSQVMQWVCSTFSGFFVVLPVWFVSQQPDEHGVSPDTLGMIMITTSAALSLPINADGAHGLWLWIKSFDLKDRALDYLLTLHNPKYAPIRNRHLALRKARNLIVDHMQTQARLFSTSPAEARQKIREEILGERAWDKLLTKLLTTEFAPEQLTPLKPLASKALTALFIILILAGVYQNIGFAADAFDGGKELLPYNFFGMICAFFELLPAGGFTIKGISGINQMRKEIAAGQKSLEEMESPKAYRALVAFSVSFGLLSGFTGDQVNFEAIQKIRHSTQREQIASGIIGNIGTALTYNTPQALLFALRAIRLIQLLSGNDDLKSDIVFRDSLLEMASTLAAMPMEKTEEFFNHDEMPQAAFFSVLREAHKQKRITVEEIEAIGESYATKAPELQGGMIDLAAALA